MILVCDNDQNDARFDSVAVETLSLQQVSGQHKISQLIYLTHPDQATLLGMKGNNQFQFFVAQR